MVAPFQLSVPVAEDRAKVAVGTACNERANTFNARSYPSDANARALVCIFLYTMILRADSQTGEHSRFRLAASSAVPKHGMGAYACFPQSSYGTRR
jgi:hypothetical protein